MEICMMYGWDGMDILDGEASDGSDSDPDSKVTLIPHIILCCAVVCCV